MKSITLFAALAAAVPALANLTINTPASVVVCEPTQLQWSGGTAPYYLTLVPAGQISASPIEQFGTQNGTSYTWNVNLGQGTSFTIALKDSTGATAYSDIVTVQPGTDTSCVGASASGSATSGSSATAASGSTAAGASTAAGSTPTGSSGSSASSTSSASGSSSTKASGAGRLSVSYAFGVAAVMGLVGAALF